MSNQFSFIKNKVTGGLIYFPGCYVSADIQLKWGAANISTWTVHNYLSNPLNTWANSIKLSVNRVNVGIAHSYNLEVSYLLKTKKLYSRHHIGLARHMRQI